MTKKKIVLVVGARPNFMKSAPLMHALRTEAERYDTMLIHTGQHYDHKLSQLFFEELKMPRPDIFLGVGSGTHAEQTARIMIEMEKALLDIKPELVVVFGDVNSTLATSLVTSKLNIRLAHVEAGLRSFDHTMPEEINRIVTDRLSDLLFVSEESGLKNLTAEGVPSEKIFHVGNIMIDSLVTHLEAARASKVLGKFKLKSQEYIALTMHRPSNVDSPDNLSAILGSLEKLSHKIPIIFPCHPRTQSRIKEFGLLAHGTSNGFKIIEPLGYLDFLRLQTESKAVLTDSGGIQEETTYLKIPCITMRENTERPSTVDIGSNIIIGNDPGRIYDAVLDVINGRHKRGNVPKYWDGQTAGRVVGILKQKV